MSRRLRMATSVGFDRMAVACLVMVVVLVGGCATSDQAFIHARRLDTVSAYQNYISKNPKGPNRQAAQKRLNVLRAQQRKAQKKRQEEHAAFVAAQRKGTLEAYRAYLKKYTTQFDKKSKEDADTRAAVKVFRRLELMAVLGPGGRRHVRLKPGNAFPIGLFSIEDLVKTGGVMVMHFASYTGEGRQTVGATGASGNLIGRTRSSTHPSVSVVFYNDPDSRLTFEITVTRAVPASNVRRLSSYDRAVAVVPGRASLPPELRGGMRTIKLGGRSLAVVTIGKSKEVYVFGKWPEITGAAH